MDTLSLDGLPEWSLSLRRPAASEGRGWGLGPAALEGSGPSASLRGSPSSERVSTNGRSARREEDPGLKTDQISVITDALAQVWDGEQHLACGAVIDATMGYGKTYLIAALCRAYRGSGIVVATKSATVVKRLVDGLTELLKDDGITVGRTSSSSTRTCRRRNTPGSCRGSRPVKSSASSRQTRWERESTPATSGS